MGFSDFFKNRERWRDLRQQFLNLGNNRITIFGTVLATVSAVFILTFLLLDALGFYANPYVGIIALMILPGAFLLGLLAIPIGILRQRRKGGTESSAPYPRLDFNDPRLRKTAVGVGFLTLVNILIFSTVSYKGAQYMDSAEFCGKVCHSVMSPEYSTYTRSPHSRVECVSCHIGPGAPSFVQAKLSGVRQVAAVTFKTYSRPIPTPVHTLRPARDTCEQCHWPEKSHGDKIRVITRYADDEKNTAKTTILLMKIGAGNSGAGTPYGIHGWHINGRTETTYIAADPKRQIIPWVQVKDAQGKITEYSSTEAKLTPEQIASRPKRTMDCIDCHNRPTHIFKMPEDAVDEALNTKKIDSQIPYIKKKSVEVLKAGYPNGQTAQDQIAAGLGAFYKTSYPALYASRRAAIESSIRAVQELYSQNVFPQMNIQWGTHPDNLGHLSFPGCFRCHDDNHKSKEGKTIPQDCNACHAILALEEEKPKLLNELVSTADFSCLQLKSATWALSWRLHRIAVVCNRNPVN